MSEKTEPLILNYGHQGKRSVSEFQAFIDVTLAGTFIWWTLFVLIGASGRHLSLYGSIDLLLVPVVVTVIAGVVLKGVLSACWQRKRRGRQAFRWAGYAHCTVVCATWLWVDSQLTWHEAPTGVGVMGAAMIFVPIAAVPFLTYRDKAPSSTSSEG